MGDITLTPLGEHLERARGGMSKREAARRAGISEGRWRQIVTGTVKVGGGVTAPANPRRETVIAMATAVGADIDEALHRAGMTPRERADPPPAQDRDAAISDVAAAILGDTELIEEAKQHLLNQYQLLRRLPPQTSLEAAGDTQAPDPVVPPPEFVEGARAGMKRVREGAPRPHRPQRDEGERKRGTGTRGDS